MPTIILLAIVRLFAATFRALVRRARIPPPQSLCVDCSFAHIQYGACGRRTVSCTFAGNIRPMRLDVLYCTDYRSRCAPISRPMGFVPESAIAE